MRTIEDLEQVGHLQQYSPPMATDPHLRSCPYCHGREFLCIQRAAIDVAQVTEVFGLAARQSSARMYLEVTILACRQCGRMDQFLTNSAQIAPKLGASVVTAGA